MDSPFQTSRFEYEQKNVYYLPKERLTQLESSTQLFLVGSRGSGKTTLLQALYWKERQSNEFLQSEIQGSVAVLPYLGVYLKLPDIQVSVLSSWLSSEDPVRFGLVFGLYIDLVWLELVADAINSLLSSGTLRTPTDREMQIIADIVENSPSWLVEGASVSTTFELARAIKRARKRLEKLAQLRVPFEKLLEAFSFDQIGVLGQEVASRLARLCCNEGDAFHFKICMDEGECLGLLEQRTINTLVRLSAAPVFFVISYVSQPKDTTETLVPNLTLQKADVQLIALDEMDDGQFKDLAQGVLNARIRALTEDSTSRLDLDAVFGRLDLNDLLTKQLSTSENARAKHWLQKARELSEKPFLKSPAEESEICEEIPTKGLPIYQAYLVERLGLKLPEPGQPRWQRRSQESREIRKKMVAAYLSLCNELKMDVRYTSSDMLLQMSDLCMRDFLAQVNGCFEAQGQTLASFLSSPLSFMTQDKALKLASQRKADSIPHSEIANVYEAGQLIDGLAQITHEIQIVSADGSHLASSERGRFQIRSGKDAQLRNAPIFSLIRQIAEAGFLKILKADSETWVFRVHTSLAAAYKFSYRGAYYISSLEISELDQLRKAATPEATSRLVSAIVKRINRLQETTPMLPGLIEI
jgi:hypothetical protein